MMGKNLLTFGWIVLLVLVISSCEKDDDTVKKTQTVEVQDLSQGQLKIVMDDSILTAQSSSAVLTDENFTLVVELPDNRQLTIVTDTLANKSFDLSSESASLVADSHEYISKGGSFVITEVNTDDKTVSGTFSISLEWGGAKIDISSGAFRSLGYTVNVNKSPEDGYFTATVNGNAWSAEAMTAKVNSQVNVLDVMGAAENDVDIKIYFDAGITEGTYPLTANGSQVAIVYEPGKTIATHYSHTGELTITKHDTENNIIEGTFSFTATSQSSSVIYEVTDGEFSYEGYY